MNFSLLFNDINEGKEFMMNKVKSLEYINGLIIKYLHSNIIINDTELSKKIFLNENIRKMIEILEANYNKDGFPIHYCWNECKIMCDGVYSICHLFCFHCCQTEGSSPLCR